jgi:hypothetical protein
LIAIPWVKGFKVFALPHFVEMSKERELKVCMKD